MGSDYARDWSALGQGGPTSAVNARFWGPLDHLGTARALDVARGLAVEVPNEILGPQGPPPRVK